MKIATFMETFPALSETYILWHMSELIRSGQEVELYPVQQGSTEKVHEEVHEFDLLERMHVAPPIEFSSQSGKLKFGLELMDACVRYPVEMARLYRSLRGYCAMGWPQVVRHLAHLGRRMEVDVLHGYFGPPGRRAQMLRESLQLEAPLVVSFLGFDLNVLPNKTPSNYYAQVFDGATALCVSSQFMKGRILELGAPEERVTVLPLGLPVKRFTYQERGHAKGEPLRLLSAARLTEVKGIEWGLRGVSLALDAGVDVRWEIFGDGPLRGELEALCKELGLDEHVTFHGFVTMDRVKEGMSRVDAALFPGVSAHDGAEEALGGAVLEAQASGMPVIASQVGGVPEAFVLGESGLLVPQKDAQAIADAIVELYSRRDAWGDMGRKGREHIEQQYDCGALNERWLAFYASLV